MTHASKPDAPTEKHASPAAFNAEVERLLSLAPKAFAVLDVSDLDPIIATIRVTSNEVSIS